MRYLREVRCWHVIIVLFLAVESIQSLKILIFAPVPWRSQQFVIRELARGLGLKGHQVDLWTPLPMNNPPKSVNQIQVRDTLKDAFEGFDFGSYNEFGPWRHVSMNYELIYLMIEMAITKGNAFRELLDSNAQYDIVITEYSLHSEPLAYLAHRFNALNVGIKALLDHPWTNELAGLPDNPSYMVTYQTRTSSQMDFLGRLHNAYTTWVTVLASYWYVISKGQQLADKYITYPGWENRPSLMEILRDADLILLNSHPSISYPYPRAPHVKEIGGMHIQPNKPLPKDIQDFLDGATEGAIFFSLGSNIDATVLVNTGAFDAFVHVFKSLKQRVLWKVSPGLPAVVASNILTKTWYPQQDILAHQNLVLFITHGGLQSAVETINHGVPVVVIPYMYDQFKNAEYLASSGMGVKLTNENLTESSISSSINEVLRNPKYRETAMKKQAVFKDRPMKPIEEAVYWIEYVGRHGKVLQPASARMPFYQLYLLDVAAFLLIVAVIVLYVLKYTMKVIYTKLFRKAEKKTPQKQKRS